MSTRAMAWAWRSARKWSNSMAAGYGSSRSRAGARPFTSHCRSGGLPREWRTVMASKREILVVEDNPGDAYLICDVLNKGPQPCHVSVAVNGVKALDFLREHDCDGMAPDMVLLDLNLPVKAGR